MTGIVCPLESRGVMIGVSVCSVAMHGCTAVGKRDCGEALDLHQSETQSPYRLNRQSDYWLGAHSLLCGAVCMSASILPNTALIKNELPKTMKPGPTVAVSFVFSLFAPFFALLKKQFTHNWYYQLCYHFHSVFSVYLSFFFVYFMYIL